MNIKIAILRAIHVLLLALALMGCTGSERSPREMTVTGSGTNLYVTIVGERNQSRILVGIHGGPGNSSGYLLGMEQLAGNDLAVVLYDQRGAGLSSEPSNGYALSRYVEDLEAVREAIGVAKLDLFGHSWGGVVALKYATVHPERVRSLILMGSGPPRMQDVIAAQLRFGERMLKLQEEGFIPGALPAGGNDLVRAILPAYFLDPGFEMPESLATMPFNQTASDKTFADSGEWDFVEEVGKLELPVLLLWGEDDPFGMEMLEATQSALSQASVDFVLLKDCGHYWHECEADFVFQLRRFLGLPEAS